MFPCSLVFDYLQLKGVYMQNISVMSLTNRGVYLLTHADKE